MQTLPLLRSLCCVLYLSSHSLGAEITSSTVILHQPQLNGEHYRITALYEVGFLDVLEDPVSYENNQTNDEMSPVLLPVLQFSGYLIDMLAAISIPERANFTYDLIPPSGYGSSCSPRLASSAISNIQPYDARYRTQYNCGADDVNDDTIPENWKHIRTDMYLGMFYITPSRQLVNQFSIPFLPPTTGTLTMFGTATNVADLSDLVQQQAAGTQKVACVPAGTAILSFVETAYPGVKLKGIEGGEDEIYNAFDSGECEIYIVDYPIAAQTVLRYSQRGWCLANGKTIGVIGKPMDFGPSHYAIGIRADIPTNVTSTISYWLNVLMTCSPGDAEGECEEGNLASLYEGKGGTGMECGYVQYPAKPQSIPRGTIIGFSMLSIPILLLIGFGFHWMRLKRRHRMATQEHALAGAQATREREINEFIATEVKKPLGVAKKALDEVYSRSMSTAVPPDPRKHRAILKRKLELIAVSIESIATLVDGLGKNRQQESAPGDEMQKFDQVLQKFSSHRSLDCSLDGMIPDD